MSEEGFIIWTVYKHPIDYPDKYVARRFVGDKPSSTMMAIDDIDVLRVELSNMGLVCLERFAEDEEHIMECWI